VLIDVADIESNGATNNPVRPECLSPRWISTGKKRVTQEETPEGTHNYGLLIFPATFFPNLTGVDAASVIRLRVFPLLEGVPNHDPISFVTRLGIFRAENIPCGGGLPSKSFKCFVM
jgi:hypothetical protein